MSPIIKTPEMPPVIVGTAGHVDHGKTSLVKLLTGCDTDRLKEEKERGMSINLGFAPCLLPGNRVVGMVDVPGHIDFIRNMVAGAASIDILLLVIAADDGIMPQTIEHMQIIRLLKAPRLVVALTKTDLVDAEILQAAKEEIEIFLMENGYGDAPVIPVSNTTLEGISDIRKELERIVNSIEFMEDRRAFRMNIERIFQLKGFGTVVSGIPLSGKLNAGEELDILPIMEKTVVRTIQNYKHGTDRTAAGICSAINIRHADASELSRGMTIAAPGYFKPTKQIIAKLINIGKTEIKSSLEYKFHSGTSELSAKITMIEPLKSLPGSTAICRVRFSDLAVLAAGDSFVLRRLSPSVTVGGGSVIAASVLLEKRSSPSLKERLEAAEKALIEGDFFRSELLGGANFAYARDELVKLSRFTGEYAVAAINEKIKSGILIDIGMASYLVAILMYRPVEMLGRALNLFHRNNPNSHGMDLESVLRVVKINVADPAKFASVLTSLKDSPFKISSGRLALRSFSPKADNPMKEKVLSVIRSAGANCIAVGNLLKETGLEEKELKIVIGILAQEKSIVTIGNHYMCIESFAECMEIMKRLASQKEIVPVPDFKNAAGMGRNIAVESLEKFDAIGFTLRCPEGRQLKNKSSANPGVR